MLDCGSDFHPVGRDEVGAFDRIVREQIDGLDAQTMIIDLAQRSRDDARLYLARERHPRSAASSKFSM